MHYLTSVPFTLSSPMIAVCRLVRHHAWRGQWVVSRRAVRGRDAAARKAAATAAPTAAASTAAASSARGRAATQRRGGPRVVVGAHLARAA